MIGLTQIASIVLSAAQTAPVTVGIAPPPNSCAARAGSLDGKGATLPLAVDGSKLKRPSDIEALRSKAKGAAIVIDGGDFSGQKFGSDDFSNVCFRGTKLAGSRWSKTRAPGIAFINADLTGAVFDRVNFDHVLFRNSALARVEAMGMRMNYGRFDGGWDPSIAGLRLDNAQMIGFRFICGSTSADGCSFDRKQMSLRGANLSGASIASFALWDANLDDVQINQTEISVDQITQLNTARVTGPVLVRIDNRRVSLTPAALGAAARAISATKVEDVRCVNPETSLDQLVCQAGQSGLRAMRDDIDRLYASTQLNPGAVENSAIIVRAPDAAQQKYLKAIRNCALRDGDLAIGCLNKTIAKRRAILVGQLLAKRPLESDARALFVSAQTPLVQAIAKDPVLAALTPLVVDASPYILLAYRDDDDALQAHGVGQASSGKKCAMSFGPLPKKARKTKGLSPSFAAWAVGAEFVIADTVVAKKVKKSRKKNAVQPVAPQSVSTPLCGEIVQSGSLVRMPISDDDFDRLWAARKSRL